MQRVSTNLTLLYKFFIPVFWIVFFGAFTIAVLVMNRPYYGTIPGDTFRIGTIFFFLSGVVVLLFTLMRLKRVEMADDYIYITNYFKTLRYPYSSIDRMEESNFLFIKLVSIYLNASGSFGKRITFVASNSRYRIFWEKHPGMRDALVGKEG